MDDKENDEYDKEVYRSAEGGNDEIQKGLDGGVTTIKTRGHSLTI